MSYLIVAIIAICVVLTIVGLSIDPTIFLTAFAGGIAIGLLQLVRK